MTVPNNLPSGDTEQARPITQLAQFAEGIAHLSLKIKSKNKQKKLHRTILLLLGEVYIMYKTRSLLKQIVHFQINK